MMADDHAATPVLTRIKAMVTAAAIQHYEEGNQAPSAGRPASSRQPSGRERAQGSQRNVVDAHNSINNNRDTRNVINGRRREREEDENRRRRDEREHFGVHNDRPPRDNRRDRRPPPRPSPPRVGIDGIRAFTPQLRRAEWPTGFSPKGIKTYDGDRDPEAWLRIYTTAIKAIGGNQNTMANYLPVVLSPTVQDWLTELPANSINSWGDLCARFISNFQGTFTKPGVEWVLYQITQKKDESLWEFIRRFIKKKNSIANVSNAVIMAT